MNLIAIISAVLIAVIAGYREVDILCSRGSWKWNNFKQKWFWFTDQNNADQKNYDSFHISNGIIFIIIALLLSALYMPVKISSCFFDMILNVVIYWAAMMYLRDIMMHIILPKWSKDNPNFKLLYLLPVLGGFLDKRN